eukprot:scaffold97267_cov36-Phaeocystis_antarctica.AAC.1
MHTVACTWHVHRSVKPRAVPTGAKRYMGQPYRGRTYRGQALAAAHVSNAPLPLPASSASCGLGLCASESVSPVMLCNVSSSSSPPWLGQALVSGLGSRVSGLGARISGES